MLKSAKFLPTVEPHTPAFRELVAESVNSSTPTYLIDAPVCWLDGNISPHPVRLLKGCTLYGVACFVRDGRVYYDIDRHAWALVSELEGRGESNG